MALNRFILTDEIINRLETSGFTFSAMTDHKTYEMVYDSDAGANLVVISGSGDTAGPSVIYDYGKPALEIIIDAISDGIYDHILSAAELNDLSDVIITNPASGEVIKYDGTNWVNGITSGGSSVSASLSGTDNYISKFSNGSTILVESQIYDAGGNISANNNFIVNGNISADFNAANSDTDRFLVSADGGEIKYRTGTEVLSDINAASSSHNHTSANITDFVENVQDAIGYILQDSPSINLVYNDVTPYISAEAIPGGIDHDDLLNYAINEHRAWETSIAQNIHADNITEGSVTQHEAALSISTSQISDFTESTEDVVGSLMVDSPTVNFTYNDASSELSATVIESAIDHNNLNNLQGGDTDEYYHLSASDYTDLTDGGDAAIHYHSSDRNRSNHTGTQLAETISNFETSAQAAVGNILIDSSTINFTYNDSIPGISATVIESALSIDYSQITGLINNKILYGQLEQANNFTYDGSTNVTLSGNDPVIKIQQNGGANGGGQLWITAAGTDTSANAASVRFHNGGTIWGQTGSGGLYIGSSDRTSVHMNIETTGDIVINETPATTDTDKFMVLDSGTIKYRTGAEILSDIGGAAVAHASEHEVGGSDIVNHDSLTGFVSNEHINHTSVTLSAGNGLTGGGNISANRTFAVGAGTGITVNANDVALSHLGIESLADPNADRIMFWDDSEGAMKWLTPGTGLSITATNLNVSLSSFDTGDLSEGTNLYYTNTRADARIAAANLEDLSDVVAYSSLADGELLEYNTAAGGWRHRTLAELSITSGTGALNRIAVWSDSNTLTSYSAFTYDDTKLLLTGKDLQISSGGLLKIFASGSQASIIGNVDDGIYAQGAGSSTNYTQRLFSQDGDGTDTVSIQLYGKGTPSALTDTEYLQIAAATTTSNKHQIIAGKGGTGTSLYPIELRVGSNTGQLVAETNGTLSIIETAATSDPDKFMVLDSGVIKYRTGAEVLSDIDAVGGTGSNNQVAVWSGTSVLDGSANLTFDGSMLALTGSQTINGPLFLNPGSQDYAISAVGNILSLQSLDSGKDFALRMYTNDGDNTDNVVLHFYTRGTPTDNSVVQGFRIKSTPTKHELLGFNGGGTSLQPIHQYANGYENQFILGTDNEIKLVGKSATDFNVYLSANDSDLTDNINFKIVAAGNENTSDYSFLNIGYNSTDDRFEIKSYADDTTYIYKSIHLNADSGVDGSPIQLFLDINNGSVGIRKIPAAPGSYSLELSGNEWIDGRLRVDDKIGIGGSDPTDSRSLWIYSDDEPEIGFSISADESFSYLGDHYIGRIGFYVNQTIKMGEILCEHDSIGSDNAYSEFNFKTSGAEGFNTSLTNREGYLHLTELNIANRITKTITSAENAIFKLGARTTFTELNTAQLESPKEEFELLLNAKRINKDDHQYGTGSANSCAMFSYNGLEDFGDFNEDLNNLDLNIFSFKTALNPFYGGTYISWNEVLSFKYLSASDGISLIKGQNTFELLADELLLSAATGNDCYIKSLDGDLILSAVDYIRSYQPLDLWYTNSSNPTIRFACENSSSDMILWEVLTNRINNDFGYYLKYGGSDSGDLNTLELWSHGGGSTSDINVYKIYQTTANFIYSNEPFLISLTADTSISLSASSTIRTSNYVGHDTFAITADSTGYTLTISGVPDNRKYYWSNYGGNSVTLDFSDFTHSLAGDYGLITWYDGTAWRKVHY